ncbi:MAG: hypothetical protein RL226_1971 [Bacteroidota bacterium]|jgi:thiamine-monophosphate kinase
MSETTNISELGEFGLIRKLTTPFELNNASSKLGVGDDAAVLKHTALTVVTTDMLTEGVHFDLMYAPLKHLGYKAVTVNLSDVAAMNAEPRQILVSLGVSSRFTVEALEELYSGIRAACAKYQVDLVGGDTTTSRSGLTISITALGEVSEGKLVRRSGARKGDLLVVSGDLGGAYMGLQVLEREKAVFKDAPTAQPELDGFEYILERQLKPEPRLDVIKMLDELNVVPTSMIDISDGLASEIFHLCSQSKTGIRLYEDKIPIDQQTYDTAREFDLDPTLCALSGGEDYELLFTIPQEAYEAIKDLPHFSVIGYMTEASEGYEMITKDGHQVPLQAQGWDAFGNYAGR